MMFINNRWINTRHFDKDNLSVYQLKTFKKFVENNYPGANTQWNVEFNDIEFIALIESGTWNTIGLLVAAPYDGHPFGLRARGNRKMHIRMLAIEHNYRKQGLGTKLLTEIAHKYPTEKITLNVDFDRLDLLNYYCNKGYATQEEVNQQEKVVILYLNHLKLLSLLPLPTFSILTDNMDAT